MPPPRPGSPLTRRTALLAGLGGLGLVGAGGCSLDGIGVQVPGSASQSPTPSGPGAAASPALRDGDPDVDEELVSRLVTRLQPALALVVATSAKHPALRGRLAPLSTALRADLTTLRDAVEDSRQPAAPPTSTVPADRAAALRGVVGTITSLRDRLRRDALDALSGHFARLIASMAAALSQRLQALAAGRPATQVPSLTGTPAGTDDGDSPLQSALAGEHAAVHVYGVLGAQTSQTERPDTYDRLLAAYTWHRGCRDRLVGVLRSRGVTPVASAPSYALPNQVATPAQVVAAALVVERRVTATYGRLVQETTGRDRQWAVTLLDQGALRQLVFGGRPETFPGTTA